MKLACQEGMVPGKTLEEKLDNLARWGYEGLEVLGHQLRDRVKEIRKATSKGSVKVSTICTGYSGCLLGAEKSERELAVSEVKELLSIGAELGAVGLIVVPVFGVSRLPDLSPFAGAVELERRLLLRLLEEIAPHAEQVKCMVLLEPLNRYETHFMNTLKQGVDLARRVNNPYVKIMADFFHMSIEERDIASSLRAAGDWVQHIHLADSTRQLPGHGHTDFAAPFAQLKRMGYKNYMALECGVPGDPAVEFPKSARYLRQWI
jgi:sugar phosphate isomerase/epimerase